MIESENNLTFFDCNSFIGKHQNPYISSTFEIGDLINTNTSSRISGSLIFHSASVLYDSSFGNQILIKAINLLYFTLISKISFLFLYNQF